MVIPLYSFLMAEPDLDHDRPFLVLLQEEEQNPLDPKAELLAV
jgi:hypothetical protein